MERTEKRKYHYIYKTTCLITSRYYIGMHSTDNLDDGYVGSGKRLWFSINYHGKENHVKEIIEFLPTRKALKEREKSIVTKLLILEPLCMNLQEGGVGGFVNEEHMLKCSKAGNIAFKEKLKNDKEFFEKFSKQRSEISKNSYFEGKIKRPDWNGKYHSEETKQKMSETSKDTGTGETNSQYGTCWIMKDGINKKIKKKEIDFYLSEGWFKGRFTELKGEMVHNSKLSDDDVIKIKKLLDENELTQVKIGKLFNVHQETISKIKRKLIWK